MNMNTFIGSFGSEETSEETVVLRCHEMASASPYVFLDQTMLIQDQWLYFPHCEAPAVVASHQIVPLRWNKHSIIAASV